jgi:hypothetical protein
MLKCVCAPRRLISCHNTRLKRFKSTVWAWESPRNAGHCWQEESQTSIDAVLVLQAYEKSSEKIAISHERSKTTCATTTHKNARLVQLYEASILGLVNFPLLKVKDDYNIGGARMEPFAVRRVSGIRFVAT